MNLVVNGNFQTGTFAGWTAVNSPTISTNGFPSGPPPNYAARLIQFRQIYQFINITPNTSYTVSFQRKGTGDVTLRVRGDPTFADYINQSVSVPVDWTLYSSTFLVNSVDTILFLSFGVSTPGSDVLLDEISIVTTPICYTGDTMIRTRNLLTGEREETRVDTITSKTHSIVNTQDQEIKVIKNIISGPVHRIVVFQENEFGPGLPNKPLKLTRGHKLVINGEEIRAGDLSRPDNPTPHGVYQRCDPELVYSLVLPTRQHIYANNQPVVAFGLDEWNAISHRVSHTTTDSQA
jgi:hypothetical protein